MNFYTKLALANLAIATVGFGAISCTAKPTSQAPSGSTVLGEVDGKTVTTAELSDTEKNAFYKVQKQYYDATENLLAQYYFNQYLEDYRVKNKLASLDEAKKSFFEKNATVTQAEVDKFLKDNAEMPQLKQIPEDKRSQIVSNYLTQMAQSKATQQVIQTAMEQNKIVVKNVVKPVAPKFTFTATGYKLLPDDKAPVTVVEFADYQCPYCVMAHDEIQKTLAYFNKNGKNQVQFVYYDFPLSFHDQAVPASVAAYCASQQGQFWPMHDKIFTRKPQDPITAETYTTYATDLKLDMVAFKTCQQDPKAVEFVNAQMAEGQRVGVQGTPAIFINGVKFEKQATFDNLKQEINANM